MPIPSLEISHFEHPHHAHYRCIVADGEIIYKVEAIDKFYEAFGYTKQINSEGTLQEEYFWKTFIAPNSTKHFECIQFLLMTFPHNVCCEFRNKYGEEYLKIAGKCNFSKRSASLPCLICVHSPLH